MKLLITVIMKGDSLVDFSDNSEFGTKTGVSFITVLEKRVTSFTKFAGNLPATVDEGINAVASGFSGLEKLNGELSIEVGLANVNADDSS